MGPPQPGARPAPGPVTSVVGQPTGPPPQPAGPPPPPVVSMVAMSVPPPPVITMASLPVSSVSSVQCIYILKGQLEMKGTHFGKSNNFDWYSMP